MIKFALAGNPNSGKTTLFNNLTGSTAHVGNWPGVTVDKKEGVYKKLEEPIQIVDLPGIYSLSPYTPEEVIARDFILDEKPDAVINIVDATNLERNLYLTTQLMEMDVPVIVALNFSDELVKLGKAIDAKKLEEKLGIPVVLISALRQENIKELMEVAYNASKNQRVGKTILDGTDLATLVKNVAIAFKGLKVDNPLFHAIKLIEQDEIEVKHHENLLEMIDEFKATFNNDVFGNDLEAIIADERYKFISKECSKTLEVVETNNENGKVKTKKLKKGKKSVDPNAPKLSKSDRIDKVLTNKWAGIPIFLVILFVVFHLIFSEDFLYLGAMGVFTDAAGEAIVDFAGTPWEGTFVNGALMSPGVMIMNALANSLGALQGVITDAMSAGGVQEWAVGLVGDGILSGIFAVFGFLPQILLLFLAFSIMEDTGYMARVAFILDRIFRRFGVTGRAFLPMMMGFGCSLPAMANTRTLADEKERIATIRAIPYFSCMAKLPILTAIAGALASDVFGLPNADLIVMGMYLLGIIVAMISIIVLRNTTLRGEVAPFIMELPSYRMPQAKALGIHVWDKTKHFVKKAFTIILASTILIWFLTSFNFSYEFLAGDVLLADGTPLLNEAGEVVRRIYVEDSILADLSRLLMPLFTPMGFGSQLSGQFGWVFVAAAISGLIAKENVIVVFAVLGAMIAHADPDALVEEGDTAALLMMQATNISISGAIAFIAFNITTVPCFAACATAKAELRKGTLKYTVGFWLITSWIVGSVIYLVGDFIWPLAIILPLFIAAGVGIWYWNKKHPIQHKELE